MPSKEGNVLNFDSFEPMAVRSGAEPFDDPAWGFEVKYDGCRVLAAVQPDRLCLRTGRGTDATAWFPEVVQGLRKLPASGHVLDGEMCVLDACGRSDFGALRNRVRRRNDRSRKPAVTYCAFDLLVYRGRDIRSRPLAERKRALAAMLANAARSLRYVEHIVGDGRCLYAVAGQLDLEGLVAKRLASPYRCGIPSSDWLKLALRHRRRFAKPGP